MEEIIEKMAEWLWVFNNWAIDYEQSPESMKKLYRDKARSLLQIQTEKLRLAVVEKGSEDCSCNIEGHCGDVYVKEATDATE